MGQLSDFNQPSPHPKVWVVFGSSGEFSDHTYWPVKAFMLDTEAEKFAKEQNDWIAERNEADLENLMADDWHEEGVREDGEWGRIANPPGDPECAGEADTKYTVVELPLDTAEYMKLGTGG